MTNINENLQKMLSARYGRDMRQAIHDSINAINNKVEQYDNTEIKQQVEELQNSMISEEQLDGKINELLDENGVNKAVENINDIGEYSYDVEVELEYQLETGGFYNYNSGNIQETNNSKYSHGVIDLAEHKEIKKIHLDGETYYQVGLIFITDENDKKLYSYPDNPDSCGIKVSIDVNLPDNARYIYYSTVSSKDFTLSFFKGRYILSNVATKEQLDNLLKRVDVKSYKKEEVEFEYKTGVYLNKSGSTTEADGWLTSKLINVAEGETYYITAKAQWQVVCYALFDNNGRFISYDGYNDGSLVELNDYELVIPDGIYNIRICGKDGYFGLKKKVKQTIAEKVNQLTDELDNTKEKEIGYGNVLYSKKYVACGDSFTEGDFTSFTDKDGLSGKDSPVIYDTNRKMYKTYPWWIAERNNMTLVNEAKCGSDFTNVDGASNPFSVSRYQEVPTDADYITLMFGLNETGLTDEQIGTNTDTDNTTLWGAYNIVFEYFLTNMPYAKIGVILADAWMPTKYSNAVKEICKYWGISYLDLKDDNIPMGIGGKNISVSDKAKELRNSAFKVSSTNGHPNVKAHEYRSTIIENFLRSL